MCHVLSCNAIAGSGSTVSRHLLLLSCARTASYIAPNPPFAPFQHSIKRLWPSAVRPLGQKYRLTSFSGSSIRCCSLSVCQSGRHSKISKCFPIKMFFCLERILNTILRYGIAIFLFYTHGFFHRIQLLGENRIFFLQSNQFVISFIQRRFIR